MKERSKPAVNDLPRLSKVHFDVLLWHYHTVNHMNNAIRCLDISLGHPHTIHLDPPVTVLNLEILPLESPDRSRLLQVTCRVLTLNYMRVCCNFKMESNATKEGITGVDNSNIIVCSYILSWRFLRRTPRVRLFLSL